MTRQVRRVNMIEEEGEDTSEEDGQVVLHIQGEEDTEKPYMMEGTIAGRPFKTMIDSGSPVTIFGVDELKRLLDVQTLFVRPLGKNESYVDYNKSSLQLMGFGIAEVRVGDKKLKKARILVAK